MLKRFPIRLAQVKVGDISAKLLKWNQTNHIFFVLKKRSYKKTI